MTPFKTGILSGKGRCGGAGFYFNQAKVTPEPTESQERVTEQVETGAAPAWLETCTLINPFRM